MLKFWVKLIKENKLVNQYTADIGAYTDTKEMLSAGLHEACYHLDLAQPIIQDKHLRDIKSYSFTRFLPESFMEDISFDRMDVNIFDDANKKKK